MVNEQSFLGTGWSFPPTFDRDTARVDLVSEEEDVVQSLKIILATCPGERLMQPNFGCELSQFLFEEIRQGVITSLKGTVTDALLYHEPRIDVEGVEVSEDEAEAGLLLISVSYKIRSTNSRYNLVYPFYLNEASNPQF